jgi:hypothetical protein
MTSSESEQVLLITLNVVVLAMAEALAIAQPSTAKLFVRQLRDAKQHATIGPYAKIRAEIEKIALMVETTLSHKPQ